MPDRMTVAVRDYRIIGPINQTSRREIEILSIGPVENGVGKRFTV